MALLITAFHPTAKARGLSRRCICKDSKEASTHGHMPDKYPKPIFIAKGPGIAHKTLLEDSMLKEASTFLKAMGIDSNGFEEPLDIFL